jgi:hypothetical protein
MKDNVFKSLNHLVTGNFEVFSKGSGIEVGYKPDFTLKCNNEFIIMECENGSSRKTFVGGMLKAAHFLQNERFGTLIYILIPRKNTTAIQISNHLSQYFLYIRNLTNLKDIYVIDISDYYCDDKPLEIFSDAFYSKAKKVKI